MVRERRQHGFHARPHRAFLCAVQFAGPNRNGRALRRQFLFDFRDRASGQDGPVVLVDIPSWILGGVLVLDEQPFVALLAALQLDQHETAAQFFPVQIELDLALGQLLQRIGVAFGAERSAVPDHHGSRAIAAFGNLAFEAAILQRVIFDLHRQPLVGVTLRRSLRHGPGLQRPVNRQPEVVMQPRRGMLLHHKRISVLRSGTDFQP